LILTDGEITDMQETVDEIVNASNLPLSIIIGISVSFLISFHSWNWK
jgi:hypothetical protein